MEFYKKQKQLYVHNILFECHSDSIAKIDVDSPVTDEQNVEFSNAQDVVGLTIANETPGETFTTHKTANSDLAEFLSRPVEIYMEELSVGVDYAGVEIFPWREFLTKPSILSKITNYKLFNGVLNIKIMVNGTKFHYGRFYAGVRPCLTDNNVTSRDWAYSTTISDYVDSTAAGVYTGKPLLTMYTSRPGVFIDPGTSQSNIITWPFFYNYDWIDTTNLQLTERLGALELFQLNQLKCNSSGDSSVTIRILAWMTDVTLAGITSVIAQSSDIQFECHAGIKTKKATKSDAPKTKNTSTKKAKKKTKPITVEGTKSGAGDEYSSAGPVSGPASVINMAANSLAESLSEVPIIGTMAKATAIVSKGVWGLASLFGWSNPAILDKPDIVVEKPLGNTVNCVGNDPISRLTVDPKQELTIDPRVCGLDGDDEMSFAYIMKREAFIGKLLWNSTGDFSTEVIGSWGVHPAISPAYADGAAFGRCFTPVGFLCKPFKYWTGSLKFRIQVVASQMARGRLKLQYDPCTGGLDLTETQINTRYTHIIDLEEERDNTFEVNWTQDRTWKLANTGIGGNVNFRRADTVALLDDAISFNGVMILSVMNQLTTPDDAGVEINIFLSGGDSFRLKDPYYLSNQAFSREDVTVGPPVLPQVMSSDILFECHSLAKSDVTSQENMPEQSSDFILNGDYKTYDDNLDSVYFGESILSIRTMLKRYCPHRFISFPDAGVTGDELVMFTCTQRDIPNGPGQGYGTSYGCNFTRINVNTDYNICMMTYTRYYMQAFVGFRGSLRWKVSPNLNSKTTNSVCYAMRRPTGFAEAVDVETIVSNPSQVAVSCQNFIKSRAALYANAGTHYSSTGNQANLMYELPFQSPGRFIYCHNAYDDTSDYDIFYRNCNHTFTYLYNNDTSTNASCVTLSSVGEDFMLMGFIGVPPLFTADIATVTPSTATPP